MASEHGANEVQKARDVVHGEQQCPGDADHRDGHRRPLAVDLFGQGTHYEIYNKMGAHVVEKDGKKGVYFSVWAPAAKDVFVIGDFNNWSAYGYDMKKISEGGIYELFIPGVKEGNMYKYLIISQSGIDRRRKGRYR